MTSTSTIHNREDLLVRASLVLVALSLLATGAQALMVPSSDADLAADADEIVMGSITNVQSQWNAEKTEIVTTATVTVRSRAKGTGPETFVLTVPGGTADGVTEWVEDQPALAAGTDAFIFINHSTPLGATVLGGYQGLVPIRQDTVLRSANGTDSAVAAGPYGDYLAAVAAGESPAPPQPDVPARASGAAPVITSVSPGTASAGTETIVTITGSGFGARPSRESMADVEFSYDPTYCIYASGYPFYDKNPDDIVSWTDTQIKVKVPVGTTLDSYAGGSASSGHLFVRTTAGGISANYPFTVTFSYGKKHWDEPYRFSVNPAPFAPAVMGITNAAKTWNATHPTSTFRFTFTGMSTATTVKGDGKNLLCFAPASTFTVPTAIAEARAWSRGAQLYEVDIKFNTGYSWQVGGSASGSIYNVEAVTLHELGHVLGLNDLYGYGVASEPNDKGKVMFGEMGDSVGNMNRVTLHADDIAGIEWIYSDIVPMPGCAGPPTDTDGDGLYDDVNGNGRADYGDLVLYFSQMTWITANQPAAFFDYNGNGRIDFADLVRLFSHL